MDGCYAEIHLQNKRGRTSCFKDRPAKIRKIEQECHGLEFNGFQTKERVAVVSFNAYRKAVLIIEKTQNSLDEVKRILKEGQSMPIRLSEKNINLRQLQLQQENMENSEIHSPDKKSNKRFEDEGAHSKDMKIEVEMRKREEENGEKDTEEKTN